MCTYVTKAHVFFLSLQNGKLEPWYGRIYCYVVIPNGHLQGRQQRPEDHVLPR